MAPLADDFEEEYAGEAPDKEAKSSKLWLALIADGERAMKDYNDRCDNIDKLYGNLEKLASLSRSREMQLFWANMQTLQPAIYARAPVPVVMPRFNSRKPIARTASELLERSATVGFEIGRIDRTLKLARDGLARLGRGVVWARYEAKENGERKKVCSDYKFRRDFVHDPARCWAEVDWVAGASYLTRKDMRKRFFKHSGDVYKEAAYAVRKDDHDNTFDKRLKAKVWELWSKSANKVVWIVEGCDKVLEEAEPHLSLDEFFPCPEPAYGTLQPDSLIPVPDVLQYRDQLEEINELTGRIASLSEAVKVAGFYPAGAGEIGDAIESAVKRSGNNVALIPVSNWAMLGDGNANNMIVWWPIDQVVTTIAQLVEMRRQLIQDVYEVSGISDILRGQTNPNETLGAQELKAQTGSIRIKDRQEEMVRVSRDLTVIHAEIMAEEFDGQTLLDMAQMELPTDAEVKKQISDLKATAERLRTAVEAEMAKPEVQAAAQANPEEAKAAAAEAEAKGQQLLAQIAELEQAVTIDQVMKLLRDQHLRPFTLDIETDSTIVPDENAQKQRATEYTTSMTGLLAQVVPAVQQVPQIAPVAAEMLNYVNGVFRVGRQFSQVVEEFTEAMKQAASQPKGPDPAQLKAEADAQATQQRAATEAATAQAEAQERNANAQRTMVENAERVQALQTKQADDEQARSIRAQEAEQQRDFRAEEHAQKMELGVLQIDLASLRIDQAVVTTEGNIVTAAAKAEAGAGNAAQPQAGAPASPKRQTIGAKRDGELAGALSQLAVGQQAIAQSLSQLAAAHAAPTEIVRDPITDRPIGARKVMQ